MKNRLTVLTSLVALLAAPCVLPAQSPAPTPAKIGVINIQAAIGESAEGKKAMADLQKKYTPRQQELQRLQQEIQDLQDKLNKGINLLSEDEQRRLGRDIEDKQKFLKRSSEDFNADAGADRDEAIRRIGQKMVQVIGDYAQKNGFTLVLDNVQIPIYYAAKESDITAEIVKLYDAANPVAEAAAPAAKPATPPKPAGTPKPATTPKPGEKPTP
jgi:outer membrane protein